MKNNFTCPSCAATVSRDLPLKLFKAEDKGFFVEAQCRFCPACGIALRPRVRFSAFFAFIIVIVFGFPAAITLKISLLWFIAPVLAWWQYCEYQLNNSEEPYSVDSRF